MLDRKIFLATFALLICLASACGHLTTVCAGVGLDAVDVTITDARTGAAIAQGAVLLLHSSTCIDSVV